MTHSVANPRRRPVLAIAGTLIGIAITTTMDATGLSAFSALPLCPLFLLLWYAERLTRKEIGFVRGRARDYAIAVAYPIVVLAAIGAVAIAAGATDFTHTVWSKTLRDALIIAATTAIVASITEEGFFRGWLWASLVRAGLGQNAVLAATSIAFSLWHLSAVSLDTGFDIPAAQIPVFMINAGLLGAAWGLLRSMSGSVFVASVAHGVWNGLTYTLFAFGTRTGALGITETSTFGPEVGIVGLGFNSLIVAWLWRRSIRAVASAPLKRGYRS